MNAIVIVGVLSALAATWAVALLLPPKSVARMPWPALVVAVAASVLAVGVGRQLGAASVEFLVGASAFTLPVLVLLNAAVVTAGGGRTARWMALLLWGIVVFPTTLIVPLVATGDCFAPDCGFEDFGGALPLLVSPAAFVLLSGLRAKGHERSEPAWPSNRRTLVAVGLLWLATLVWLVHLEGTIDDYTPRIALAALVVPAASGVGWLALDRLRNVTRSILRSLVSGIAVGLAAVVPGAVSVGMPWLAIVGVLTGAAAALVFAASARVFFAPGARWALAILTASILGFLASPLFGNAVGIIFAARGAVLIVPLLALAGVVVFSAAVSALVWVPGRREAVEE